MTYATARPQWLEGERRLEQASHEQRRVLDRVVERVYAELRRRLGSAFTTEELVALYEGGTPWAEQLAMEAAPEHPWAWDPRTVVDAAFGRYLREAADHAGGRLLAPDA